MKLRFSYHHKGYLVPILMAEGNETLPRNHTYFHDDFAETVHNDNETEVQFKSFYKRATPPESFSKYLSLLETNGIITKEELAQFQEDYKKRYTELPHIGKNPEHYTEVNNYHTYDLWQASFTEEILHLQQLEKQYTNEWLVHFKKLEWLAHLYAAKNSPSFHLSEHDLKRKAQNNPVRDCFKTGENKLVDWITLGLVQERKNSKSTETLEKTVQAILQYQPELIPFLALAALWTAIGVEGRLGKYHIPVARQFLKLIESATYTELINKETNGYYYQKHAIFLTLLNDDSAETFVHELAHAIAKIVYNNENDIIPYFSPEKKAEWTEQAKKFVEDIEIKYPHEKTLNFNHYPENQFSQEWLVRWLERIFANPMSIPTVNTEANAFLAKNLQQFYKDCMAYAADLIEETGLNLIKPLKDINFFFDKQTVHLDDENIELLNSAHSQQCSVLDIYIGKAIKKNSTAAVVNDLLQKEISIYAILQTAARCNHFQLAFYILQNAKKFNFDVTATKAIKALNLAAGHGCETIVDLFLEAGIPCNIGIANHTTAPSLIQNGDHQLMPLHYAAAQGHTAIVKSLLEHGAMVDAQDENGDTPLHLAAYEGHAEVAKLLLDAKADINKKNRLNKTPLHNAAMKGKENLFKLFLSNKNIVIDSIDKDGNTALHLLLERSYLKNRLSETEAKARFRCIELLLSNNTDPNIINRSGCSTLYLAVKNSLNSVVELLLNKINTQTLNQKTLSDNTALHLAVVSGQLDVTLLLLQQPNIDVNALNCNNQNVLHLALESESLLFLTELLKNPSLKLDVSDAEGFYPLIRFIKHDYLDLVFLTLEHPNSDINFLYNGIPVLHRVVKFGKTQIVEKILTNSNLDINAIDVDGCTALHHAVTYARYDIIKLLLANKKINLEATNNLTQTPLHLAAAEGRKVLTKDLIESGANINARDVEQKTPLMLAVLSSKTKYVLWFLQDYKDKLELNAKDNSGNTALHYIIELNNVDMFKALLATDLVDVATINDTGQTPLHCAVINDKPEMVTLLLKNLTNKQIYQKDEFGKTAEDYALENHYDKVKELIQMKIKENISTIAITTQPYTSMWSAPKEEIHTAAANDANVEIASNASAMTSPAAENTMKP